ncbi:MAG: hypothetical protein QOI21_1578 [Actinomycetota bacterium]|nr:hypothetical protein [Actinomycetota bacterium]
MDFAAVVRDVDVVFDLVGNGYAARSLETLKPGGLLIDATGSEQELADANGFRIVRFYVSSSGEDLEQLTELVEAGKLRVFVDQVLPLDQVANAHDLSETQQVSGKIVLSVM